MSQDAYTITIPRPGRRARAARMPLASMLVGAVAVLAALAIFGAGGSTPQAPHFYTGPASAYRILEPSGWRPLPHGTGLERADGRGLVVVQPTTLPAGSVNALARSLTSSLRRRFGSFKPVAARLVPVRAGSGLLYSFVTGSELHSLVITGIRGRAYSIDSVVPVSAREAAAEAGAIAGSFGP